jgi:hypothetical protein
MSQNMAAGLPILANETAFVREVVAGAGAGLVVDFSGQDALVAAVDRLARDAQLREAYAQRAREHFSERFHWEALSRDLYRQLQQLAGAGPLRPLRFFGADLPAAAQDAALPPEASAPASAAPAPQAQAASLPDAPAVAPAAAPAWTPPPGPTLVDRVWRRIPERARRIIRRPVRAVRRLVRGG